MTATVAILSIGQMGLGVANLLRAHDFRVITNVSDRSVVTQDRAKSASIELFTSDIELVRQADYILSIVPPKDSTSTAQRIIDVLKHDGVRKAKKEALWFLDLNAGSPDSAKKMASAFTSDAGDVRFVDGGIIGGPPRQEQDGSWSRPGIPLCGPHVLSAAPVSGARLATVLNARYLGAEIGSASGLKACFAALSKGFTALSLQSYTTAAKLHVLPDLRHYLDLYNPAAKDRAERGIVACPTKAYRWVEEMHHIGYTFSAQGAFGEQARVFREIADVYQGLADMVEAQGPGGLESAEQVVGRLGEWVQLQNKEEEKDS